MCGFSKRSLFEEVLAKGAGNEGSWVLPFHLGPIIAEDIVRCERRRRNPRIGVGRITFPTNAVENMALTWRMFDNMVDDIRAEVWRIIGADAVGSASNGSGSTGNASISRRNQRLVQNVVCGRADIARNGMVGALDESSGVGQGRGASVKRA